MAVLLILAVLVLAFLVGRFSVQVVKYSKSLEELTDQVAVLDHTLDELDKRLSNMAMQHYEVFPNQDFRRVNPAE